MKARIEHKTHSHPNTETSRIMCPNCPDATEKIMTDHKCSGCQSDITPLEALRWGVCLPCTKARHKTVTRRGKCTCRKADRRERTAQNGLGRVWIACDRCLGTVKQIS